MDKFKKAIIKKRIFTFLFIVFLYVFALFNWWHEWEYLTIDLHDSPEMVIHKLEAAMNENFLFRYEFIELYGMTQKALDKNEENSFSNIRDKNGFWHYADFSPVDFKLDQKLAQIDIMNEYVTAAGAELLIYIPPVKYSREQVDGYIGIPYPDAGDQVDRYKQALAAEYFVVDGRESLAAAGLAYEDSFYRTDHHWTTMAAFIAFADLTGKMEARYNILLDSNHFYTDISHYYVETYKDCFLGSVGRETGIAYGGLDPFTVIYPRYDTQYSFERTGYEGVTGSFTEVLLNWHVFTTEDIYLNDKYSVYLSGISDYNYIRNKARPEGIRVLFVGDSFSTPLVSFFSTVCAQTDLIWCLKENSGFYERLDTMDYDYVILSVSSLNLAGEEAFAFMRME